MKKEILEAAKCCSNRDYICSVECPLFGAEVCNFEFAKAIIEQHERYRWHDLRKYPNDLPTEYGKDYLVAEKWDDGDITYITVNKPYIESHSPKAEPYIRTVIAWREIELFESSERCPNDYHGGDC